MDIASPFFGAPEPEPQEQFLSAPVEEKRAPTEGEAQSYSILTGRTFDDVWEEMNTLGDSALRSEAQIKAGVTQQQEFLRLLEEGGSMEEIMSQTSTAALTAGLAPDVAGLLSDANSPIVRRTVERSALLHRMVADHLGESSGGFVAGTGYFADQVLSATAKNVFTLGGEARFLADRAREMNQLLYSSVSDEEFTERANAILNEVADQGLLSDENYFYLMNFMGMVDEAGSGGATSLELGFGALDAATLPIAGVKWASSAVRAGSVPRLAAQLGDRQAAVRAIVRNAEEATSEVAAEVVSQGSSVSAIAPARAVAADLVGPELEALRHIETNNAVLRQVRSANWGSVIPEAAFKEATESLKRRLVEVASTVQRPGMDYAVRLDQGGTRIVGEVTFGRANSAPFKSAASAQKLANEINGTVAKVTDEGVEKFVVKKDYDIPVDGVARTTEVKDIMRSLAGRALSTTSRTSSYLDGMLKRGEAQFAKVMKGVAKDLKKVAKRVSSTERDEVDLVFKQVRDDPNYNQRWQAYTTSDFIEHYTEVFGKTPGSNVIEYFQYLRNMSDTEYFIRAEELLREAIRNGEEMVKLDGEYYRAKRVSNPPDSVDFVLDKDGARYIRSEDLDGISGRTLYEIKDAAYQNERYVLLKTPTTRRLYHTDVLSYNMGGHRIYSDQVKFFMRQGREGKNPTTFMGVRTEAEAKVVKEQWDNIVEALRGGTRGKALDEIIQANNDWNPNIEDLADLQAFADKKGLDLESTIEGVGEGFPMPDDGFAGPKTTGEYFTQAYGFAKRRGDDLLLGFGGDTLNTVDPVAAINRSFAHSISRKADQRYMHNAVNGWLLMGKENRAFTNWDEIKNLPARQQLERAIFDEKTEVGKALAQERFTIQHRMSNVNDTLWTRLVSGFADVVYGVSKPAAKPLDTLAKFDPAGFLRAVAFHAKLGMFAVDQLYVQASQLTAIAGVGSVSINPLETSRAFSAILPLRLSLIEDLSPKSLEFIAKAQAPVSGISPEDFVELSDWIKSTGRNIVDRTAVEENNEFTTVAGRGKAFLEYGQTFFNEGELTARLGAALVNFKEVRRRGAVDLFNDVVTDQMIKRQDSLTMAMTSASSAPWQKNLLAVPFQFTTYQMRMYESLFTKHFFSDTERYGLALSQVFMYGAAGVPLVNWIVDKQGYDGGMANTEVWDVARYGALDAALEALTGVETTLSTRLGSGDGTWQFWSDFFNNPLISSASGAGGSVTGDIINDTFVMLKNIYTNKGLDYMSYDFTRVARNLTSVDRAFALKWGMQYGEYYNRRTLETTLENMTTPEVVLKALGVPLAKQTELWTASDFNFDDADFIKSLSREIARLDNIASMKWNEDDRQGAVEVWQDINAILEPLTIAQQEDLRRTMQYDMTTAQLAIRSLLENGRLAAAERIKELTQ